MAQSQVKNSLTKKLIQLNLVLASMNAILFLAAIFTRNVLLGNAWAISALFVCILLPILILLRHTAEEQKQNQTKFALSIVLKSFLFLLLPCLLLAIILTLASRPD
jgi:hypothetical protein